MQQKAQSEAFRNDKLVQSLANDSEMIYFLCDASSGAAQATYIERLIVDQLSVYYALGSFLLSVVRTLLKLFAKSLLTRFFAFDESPEMTQEAMNTYTLDCG